MSSKESAKKFLSRVEQFIEKESNPEITKRIFSELKLDKLVTSNKEYTDFYHQITTEKVSLEKLLDYLKQSLIDNEPICRLLAYIEDNNLISDTELKTASTTLQVQINMLCIFEAITVTMANGESFAEDMYEHLVKRSGSYYPGNPFVDFFFGTPFKASLFERLKIISIKPGLLNIIFHKSTGENEEKQSDVDEFVKRKNLSGWNASNVERAIPNATSTSTVSGMGLNILEAAWQDFQGPAKESGGTDNAKAGLMLIKIIEEMQCLSSYQLVSQFLPEKTTADGASYSLLPGLKINSSKKKVSQFAIDSFWRDLYNSWNLLFVGANLDAVFLLIKLLIPSVFAAQPQNYKEIRLLSLFTFAYQYMNEDTINNPFFAATFKFANGKAILKKWGEINKEYGIELFNKLRPTEKNEADVVFEHVFGNYPNFNFLRHIVSFGLSPSQYTLTKAHPKTSSQSRSGFFSPRESTEPAKDKMEVFGEEKNFDMY
ncbi:hypothetical protein [Legionella hackeliae]|uniref:Predicted symporter n=1 Tax=Legionella hackeliae TaxID=449 RepID=A0A0A8UNT5_LEGHA|nr:hypothetical protein [Legionella hackeliae]KTD12833.1 symporter [Legionella hackeliae]CEK09136.1 Predicted symporter [Legionella hackeliae]STX49046.1 symporter [Legionella hackeliae]